MFSLTFISDQPDLLAILLTNRSNNTSILGNGESPQEQAINYTIANQIRPRVTKSDAKKKVRTKTQAEVFTPAWLCNQQNNLIDSRWFEGKSPFNKETAKNWETVTKAITFPKGKSWKDYVQANRLEICCGEAPYLTSRYDATTGTEIPVNERVGLFDRKLRIVSENTETVQDWIDYALQALKSIFGFEKSGDNLLIARLNIFMTFIEHFQQRFNKRPAKNVLTKVATITSWNIWLMDSMDEGSINQAILMDWNNKKKLPFKSLLQNLP